MLSRRSQEQEQEQRLGIQGSQKEQVTASKGYKASSERYGLQKVRHGMLASTPPFEEDPTASTGHQHSGRLKHPRTRPQTNPCQGAQDSQAKADRGKQAGTRKNRARGQQEESERHEAPARTGAGTKTSRNPTPSEALARARQNQ